MCNLKDKRFEFMRELMAVSDSYSIVVESVSNDVESFGAEPQYCWPAVANATFC